MASHWLNKQKKIITDIKGCLYIGFPLHASCKPSLSRADHLVNISLPQLFLQGTNDKLAAMDLITDVVHSLTKATLHVFEHADHSFQIPKKHGGDMKEMYQKLAETINQRALSQLRY